MKTFQSIIFILISLPGISQGIVFDDAAYAKGKAKPQIMRGDVAMPSSFSLKQYCPRPGNQLDYSTSVGWAVGWAGKTMLYAKHKNLTGDEITSHIFSPAFIHQEANPDDTNCDEGITIEEGLMVAKNKGIPPLNDYLYFCNGPVSNEVLEKAKKHKISDYAKIFNLEDEPEDKVNAVKRSIKEGYPVIVGVIVSPSFKRAKEFWQPTENPNDNYIGQAVCVVGYDDTKYGGAFEVLNSWGKNWGNDGYMWIRYKDFADYVKYAYEMFELPSNDTEIAGSLDFIMSTGDEMDVEMLEDGYYRMIKSYKAGDSFRVYINNDEPGFLYVFGSDLTNSFFQLFPMKENISAALNYKATSIAIPGPENYIQLDHTAGTDYLCVLYSREELDIVGIMNKLKSSQGQFKDKIKNVLDQNLLNNSMTWTADKVGFSGDSQKGNLVAVVVEINHY